MKLAPSVLDCEEEGGGLPLMGLKSSMGNGIWPYKRHDTVCSPEKRGGRSSQECANMSEQEFT